MINIDHFRHNHERKAGFDFIKKSSLNYWPPLQVFNGDIHWKKKKCLLSNFNSTRTRITLKVLSRILFKPTKVILGQSSRKIRYELCAAHLACIMAKDKLILVGGASGFILRCGHVVRSILWRIVLFSQRPATRKYCVRVNVPHGIRDSADTAVSSTMGIRTLQIKFTFFAPGTFFMSDFIDSTCLAYFPVDPVWRQFAQRCARGAF